MLKKSKYLTYWTNMFTSWNMRVFLSQGRTDEGNKADRLSPALFKPNCEQTVWLPTQLTLISFLWKKTKWCLSRCTFCAWKCNMLLSFKSSDKHMHLQHLIIRCKDKQCVWPWPFRYSLSYIMFFSISNSPNNSMHYVPSNTILYHLNWKI